MNKVEGTILNIEEEGLICLIEINCSNGIILKTVILSDGHTLKVKDKLLAVFKETEVSIALTSELQISLQNRIKGEIKEIEVGNILTRIIMDSPVGEISSVITTQSAKKLALKVGIEVLALIKTNEIMLEQL